MSVTANITVSFGDDAAGAAGEGSLSAEIDDREDGLNDGDTAFSPGDTAWFLVFASSNVTYDTPIASAGSIAPGGTGISVTKETDLSFADTDTASLSLPSTGLVSTTWLGTSLGDLVLQADGTTVKASAKGVAVARVEYTCLADAWGLTSPTTLAGLTDFSILVFILGHIAGEPDEPET